MFDTIARFLKESRVELKKVTWPTREDTTRYTITVVIISIGLALFLGGMDYLFQYALDTLIFR